ncbi:MAG TPA: hypothetical protein PLO50_00475 [Nitrospira sp.]|nr:hypothetical protein [Nitrospira sp.]
MGLPIYESKTAHYKLAPLLKDDTLQFEGLPDTGRSTMVQGCLNGIQEFAHCPRMDSVSWITQKMIGMGYQFQRSTIRMQQFLLAREHQNAGSGARRVSQRAYFAVRRLSALPL